MSALLPFKFTAPSAAPAAGIAIPVNGSATGCVPVTGVGRSDAVPLTLTPPTTWMLPAATLALPLATTAEVELESTSTRPGVLTLAAPVTSSVPLAVGFKT